MKKLIVLLPFILCGLVAFSQPPDDYRYRIKNGMLSYDECEKLIKAGDTESSLPSLYNLLDEYEKNLTAEIESYLKIVCWIDEYYNRIGNISLSYKLLNRADDFKKSINYNKNTPVVRELFLRMGRNESALKSYNDALHYYMTVQLMCNQVNDISDFYIGLLCNISIVYQNMDEILLADIYVEEAKELYEKMYGNLYEKRDTKDYLQVYILAIYGRLCFMMKNWDEAEKAGSFILNLSDDYQIDNTTIAIVHDYS